MTDRRNPSEFPTGSLFTFFVTSRRWSCRGGALLLPSLHHPQHEEVHSPQLPYVHPPQHPHDLSDLRLFHFFPPCHFAAFLVILLYIPTNLYISLAVLPRIVL
nr:MAG TPA: hypothetical protein [Caudoviricetes sp.]